MWLRVDDGYDSNHKIMELREVERWRWTRVLIYCAKHRNKGVVTLTVLRELGLEKTVEKLLSVGLLDVAGKNYRVHDWYVYNGESLEERVRSYLEDHPGATANEVYRVIGGKRSLVLKVYADLSTPGSKEPPADGSKEPHEPSATAETGVATPEGTGSQEPEGTGSLSGPRARARRRAPHPTPKSEEPVAAVRTESSHSKADAGLTRASFEQPAPASDTNALDTTDPINRLVLELRDRDEGTAHVLRTRYGGLAEAAFVYTREEVIRCRTDTDSDAGLANRILERIAETGFIGDPDFATANGEAAAPATRTPYERAELLIRNIGPTLEPRDLDRELDDIGITERHERHQLHHLHDELRESA